MLTKAPPLIINSSNYWKKYLQKNSLKMTTQYGQKHLGAEPRVTSLSIGSWYKKAGEKDMIIKKESSVVFVYIIYIYIYIYMRCDKKYQDWSFKYLKNLKKICGQLSRLYNQVMIFRFHLVESAPKWTSTPPTPKPNKQAMKPVSILFEQNFFFNQNTGLCKYSTLYTHHT